MFTICTQIGSDALPSALQFGTKHSRFLLGRRRPISYPILRHQSSRTNIESFQQRYEPDGRASSYLFGGQHNSFHAFSGRDGDQRVGELVQHCRRAAYHCRLHFTPAVLSAYCARSETVGRSAAIAALQPRFQFHARYGFTTLNCYEN